MSGEPGSFFTMIFGGPPALLDLRVAEEKIR